VKTGQCKICGFYGAINEETGRIPLHASLKTPTKWCRGSHPSSGKPEDYTVGYDSDPWVYGGGLPERNRNRF